MNQDMGHYIFQICMPSYQGIQHLSYILVYNSVVDPRNYPYMSRQVLRLFLCIENVDHKDLERKD